MNTGHSLFELGCMSSAVGSMIDSLYVANVMNRLRELINPHESDCKRWIWELIQNAKDSVNGQDRQVNIKIVCNNKHLIFEHDGSAFNAKALLGLLYKFSHGKSKTKGSTGRFGTGFLTTHSLSKIVHIESDVINDSDGKEDIKGFSATMYRDGLDESSLLVGVEKMKKSMIYKDTRNGFTRFTYDIIDQHGLESLSLGISNFEDNISHTLLFCPEIGAISLDNGGVHSRYRIIKRIEEGKVYHYTLEIDKGGNISYREFLMSVYEADHDSLSKKYCSNRRLLIECVVEVLNGCVVQRIETVPSIFCVFPLVGSEYIRFPFVLNSRDFEPTTERQGLLLIGSEFDDKNSVITPNGINRDILRISIDLYCRIIEHLSSNFYKELHLLSYGLNSSIPQQPDLDSEWYRCYQTSLCELLKRNRIVLCNGSYVSINEKKIIFIDYCSMNSKDSSIFHGILRIIYGFRIGDYADSLAWSRYLFSGIEVFSLNSFCSYLSEKKSIQNLESQESLHYNEFLRVLFEHFREQLNHYSLLPNQNGRFVCFNSPKFYQEKQVRDGYKHLYNLLGNDWKEEHLDIGIDSVILANVHDERSLCNFLSNSMKDLLEKSETLEEFHGILGILSNDKVYDSFRKVVQRVYEKIVKVPIKCVKFPMNGKQVFGVFDSLILKKLLSILIESKRYDSFLDESLYCEFLEHCIRTLPSIETDSLAIYSNQVGDLKCKKDLYLDTWIPEHLKDALKLFNYNIRSNLLSKKITFIRLDSFPVLGKNPDSLYSLINKSFDNKSLKNYHFELASSIVFCLPKNQSDEQEKQKILCEAAKTYLGVKKDVIFFDFPCQGFWNSSNNIISQKLYEKIIERFSYIKKEKSSIDLMSKFLYYFPTSKFEVYPNRLGNLCDTSCVCNDLNVPPLLYEIVESIENDAIKTQLIDARFNFIPLSNSFSLEKTCSIIDQLIYSKYKEFREGKTKQQVIKKALELLIFQWFKNPDYTNVNLKIPKLSNEKLNDKYFPITKANRASYEFEVLFSQEDKHILYTLTSKIGLPNMQKLALFAEKNPGLLESFLENPQNFTNGSKHGTSQIMSVYSNSSSGYELKIGKDGEQFIYEFLCQRFHSGSVEWNNEDSESGLPYDILIITENGYKIFIEVKATSRSYLENKDFEINISRNQIIFARSIQRPDSYILVQVFDIKSNPQLLWLEVVNEPWNAIEE